MSPAETRRVRSAQARDPIQSADRLIQTDRAQNETLIRERVSAELARAGDYSRPGDPSAAAFARFTTGIAPEARRGMRIPIWAPSGGRAYLEDVGLFGPWPSISLIGWPGDIAYHYPPFQFAFPPAPQTQPDAYAYEQADRQSGDMALVASVFADAPGVPKGPIGSWTAVAQAIFEDDVEVKDLGVPLSKFAIASVFSVHGFIISSNGTNGDYGTVQVICRAKLTRANGQTAEDVHAASGPVVFYGSPPLVEFPQIDLALHPVLEPAGIEPMLIGGESVRLQLSVAVAATVAKLNDNAPDMVLQANFRDSSPAISQAGYLAMTYPIAV